MSPFAYRHTVWLNASRCLWRTSIFFSISIGLMSASQVAAWAQLSLSLKSSYIVGPHYVAQGGGPQPLVELTICAVPRNAGNPVPNTTVTFSTDQPFVLSLSSTSVTSDTRGRAVIQVKGMCAGGSPTLTARWRFPPGPGGQEIQASIPIAITADD